MADERTQGLAALLQQGGSAADLFADLESPSVDPESRVRAYRGENLIKSLGIPLGSDEAAGRWYGFTAEKAARYPSVENRAPGILGGQVTRSMDVSPAEIIEASRKAMYDHGKTTLGLNLEKGVDKEVAENIYFKYLNEVDDFHSSAMRDLMEGKLPQDKFDFMLKTTMAEGVFDKKGKIDPELTIKRGNIVVGKALGAKEAASKALPYIAKGMGIAAIPLDIVAGATPTGLDPEEEVAKAYGIDPTVFYNMDPKQFDQYKKAYDLEKAAIAKQIREEVETISPMVP